VTNIRRTDFLSVHSTLATLTIVAFTCAASRAEPPAPKTLVPAGIQRDTETDVRVVGKLGTRPVAVWTSTDALTVTVPEKGDTLTVRAADDAPVGIHWLRLHNAEGAAALRPFVVGTLPELVEQEPNNEVAAANPVEAAGAVANGVLARSGDVDGFAVELEQGQTLFADVAANRDLGAPMDAVLQIVSADGFVLDQNDDTRGNDPRLVFACPADGRYVVRLFAFPATPNSTIALAGADDYVYRLTLTTGPYVDHVVPLAVTRDGDHRVRPIGWNLPESPDPVAIAVADGADAIRHHDFGPVDPIALAVVDHPSRLEGEAAGATAEIPLTITGSIGEPREVDTFAFAAQKGQRLAIRLESQSLGFPLDASLEVLDAAGKSLKKADDAQREQYDPALDFDPPADGTYRVVVRDVYETAGPRHVYRLSIVLRDPDFALTLAADRFAVAAGKSVKVPVTIDRRNGFAEPIEVRVEGLPAGVTCQPVTSDPKGATKAKLELELVAAKETGAGGPLRIVGRANRERMATAAVDGFNARTEHPWLVVQPAK
jgi:hypothetical protein